MISAFHNKFLEYLTMYRADKRILLAATILSYYLYDPGSLLANLTRRKLKLNRVSNIDEGFRILMNLSLDSSFRRTISDVFIELLSKTEVVSELITLAKDGALDIMIDALENYKPEYRGNQALNYVLEELRKIVKSGRSRVSELKKFKLRAIITLLFSSPTLPSSLLSSIGKSIGKHEMGAELWEINLNDDFFSDVEFLIYALDTSEIHEEIIRNLLSKSKIALILYDKPFMRHYRSLENFFATFKDYLVKMICIGLHTENVENFSISREILEQFVRTSLFLSDRINDLIHNCTISLLKYLEKK